MLASFVSGRTLAGPIAHILKDVTTNESSFEYQAAMERSKYAADRTKALGSSEGLFLE